MEDSGARGKKPKTYNDIRHFEVWFKNQQKMVEEKTKPKIVERIGMSKTITSFIKAYFNPLENNFNIWRCVLSLPLISNIIPY